MNTIVPNSVSSITKCFEFMGETSNDEQNFIPIQALTVNNFFQKKEIKSKMKGLWKVLVSEHYIVWIIQTSEWNRKTWRNHFINKLSHNLELSILFFIPEINNVNDNIAEYSMTIITMEGTLDYPSVISKSPNESILKIWESIKNASIEDVLEFESKILAERYKVTARAIVQSLSKGDSGDVIPIFENAGHKVVQNYVLPKDDTVLENAVLYISDNDINVKNVIEEYRKLNLNEKNQELKWIIFLNSYCLKYYYRNKEIVHFSLDFKDKSSKSTNFEKGMDLISSLIATISRRAAFNAETFALQFGEYSVLYCYAIKKLKENFLEEKESRLKVLFEEWKKRFEEVYRLGDVTEELFIKHSYLALLIRLVLYVTYFKGNQVNQQSIISLTFWLEKRGVSLFTYDFFQWSLENIELLETLFFGLRPIKTQNQNNVHETHRIFEADDIFRIIYQQMVSPSTRHALGEFYTPPELARQMIEKAYVFGESVLDPACGSGTFLVELLRKIWSYKQKTEEEQLEAIKKIYGFDVNPIAIATTKANLLLQYKEIMEYEEDFTTNVFLCNSLFPTVLRQNKSLEYGKVIEFVMPSIDEKMYLSAKFFEPAYQRKFGDVLAKLDSLLIQNNIKSEVEFVSEIESIFNKEPYEWMREKTDSLIYEDKTLFNNFVNLAKKLFQLGKENKNHIWSFLLFNSLGTYIVRDNIDLIIGNPPWIVINSIHSESYKRRIKDLAKELGIIPLSHQIPSLEMSALFLYKSKHYLTKKVTSRVFFVVSNAFVSGDNHAGTRKFDEFGSIEIWKFTKDFFNIHNICLYLEFRPQYYRNLKELKELTAKVTTFDVSNEIKSDFRFTISSTEEYSPYSVEIATKKRNRIPSESTDYNRKSLIVKKLIPNSAKSIVAIKGTNYYHSKCFSGATLHPRSFVFVVVVKSFMRGSKEVLTLKPIISSNKKQWDFNPLQFENKEEIDIESSYVFDVLKSTNVVPFIGLKYEKAFLPIEKDNSTGGYKLICNKDSEAFKYYMLLDESYKLNMKEGASLKSLWINLNYQRKLTTPRQMSEYKVVSMANGSIVKACVIKGDQVIIDYSNFYVSTKDENEAYYLCGFLNSPIVTKYVNTTQSEGAGGGGRNIYKRPYEIKLSKYDKSNELHSKIVKQTKLLEKKAYQIKEDWIRIEMQRINKRLQSKKKSPVSQSEENLSLKPMTIQNRIYKKLGWDTSKNIISGDFRKLNDLIEKMLKEECE